VAVTLGNVAPLTMANTTEDAGALVARRIVDAMARTRTRPGPFVLGCPSGRTPVPVAEAFGRLAGRTGADLSAMVVAMMDEYLVAGPGGELVNCDPAAHYSCHRWAAETLLPALNRELPPARRLKPENIRFPDPAGPAAYDTWLEHIGGLDFFLLASGASDGHVGFNPPGAELDTGTRIVALPDSTRRDNLGTFPQFGDLDEVPTAGVTVGLATITAARGATLLVTGAGKAAALQRVLRCHGFDPQLPASVIHRCRDALIVADRAAAGRERS
jgi:glucosamine-6-phosphate deaminase